MPWLERLIWLLTDHEDTKYSSSTLTTMMLSHLDAYTICSTSPMTLNPTDRSHAVFTSPHLFGSTPHRRERSFLSGSKKAQVSASAGIATRAQPTAAPPLDGSRRLRDGLRSCSQVIAYNGPMVLQPTSVQNLTHNSTDREILGMPRLYRDRAEGLT